MKINIGDYQITTDEKQFVVSKKSIVQEGRLTKAENIGKENYKPIAYCTTFNSALKFIPQQVLRDNDDILVIEEKLKEIEAIIKGLPQPIIFTIEKTSKNGEESEVDSNDSL